MKIQIDSVEPFFLGVEPKVDELHWLSHRIQSLVAEPFFLQKDPVWPGGVVFFVGIFWAKMVMVCRQNICRCLRFLLFWGVVDNYQHITPNKGAKYTSCFLVQFCLGEGDVDSTGESSSPTVIHPKLTLPYLISSKYSDLTENPLKSTRKNPALRTHLLLGVQNITFRGGCKLLA